MDRLLDTPPFGTLVATAGRPRVSATLAAEQDAIRAGLRPSDAAPTWFSDPAAWAARVGERLRQDEAPGLRPVINATGVVLHTNLGRAPLAPAALAAVATAAAGYSNLEYDLVAGARGSRYDHCQALLCRLTGAEAALVVNNNAAALLLALNGAAGGGAVAVSRGELVEIGDGFRIGEIAARSGVRLAEVGATNRTHEADYRSALADGVQALLKVHPSNFTVRGFTGAVEAVALAALAREHGVPLVHDLGSGLLLDLAPYGLTGEPTAAEALAAGADLVTMSGDKLLGGPQAGIVLGTAEAVACLRTNPLCRALRVDKLTLAALEATLRLYLDPERAVREIPALAMLAATAEMLRTRARGLATALAAAGVQAELEDGTSAVGGGAYPDARLPTVRVTLAPTGGAETMAARLRAGTPPVVCTVGEGRVRLDPRTVPPDQEDALVAAVAAASLD